MGRSVAHVFSTENLFNGDDDLSLTFRLQLKQVKYALEFRKLLIYLALKRLNYQIE